MNKAKSMTSGNINKLIKKNHQYAFEMYIMTFKRLNKLRM